MPRACSWYKQRAAISLISHQFVAALALDDSFSSVYCLLTLHVWICLAKLRCVGDDGRKVSQVICHTFPPPYSSRLQVLFDNVWDDMMHEIRLKGVTNACQARGAW